MVSSKSGGFCGGWGVVSGEVLPCRPEDVDDFLSEPTEAVVELLRRVPGDFQILGAAGKMGLHLSLMVRKAMDRVGGGRRVVAVSRFSAEGSRDEFESRGVETVACDLSDPEALAHLEDIENLVFMAGAKFGTADRPELLHTMNVRMPQLVAERFAGQRITAFSTGCVYAYAPTDSHGAVESDPTDPVGAYAKSCLGREEAFRKAAKEFATRVALIRLNYAVEFRYGVPVDLVRKILSGEPVDVSMGHVNIIWQRDAIVHALLAHELASTDVFVINVTRPETCRVRDLAIRLGELLGAEPVLVGEEAPTAWISDASKAARLFGEPEVSVDQMLRWVAAWQTGGFPLLGKPTGFEKRDGKF